MKKTTSLASALLVCMNLFATGTQTIKIATADNLSTVVAAINAAIEMGNTDIVLDFNESEAYFTGGQTLELSAGITSLLITSSNEKKPTVYLNGITFGNVVNSLTVENIKAIASGSGKYIVNYSLIDNYAKDITIRNCLTEGYRAYVRVQDKGFKIKDIVIDNCLIDGNGTCDYGILNATANSAGTSIETFTISNSTLMNCHVIADYRIEQAPGKIKILSCTVYNKKQFLKNGLVRLSGNPISNDVVCIDKLLLTGDNGGEQISGTYQNYSNVITTNSWKTNDVLIQEAKPLYGIQNFDQSTTSLFTDADNGDFTFTNAANGDFVNAGNPTRKYNDLNTTSLNQISHGVNIIIESDLIRVQNAESISVFNLAGHPITAANCTPLSISGLSSGVYLVRVKVAGNVTTHKFVKK